MTSPPEDAVPIAAPDSSAPPLADADEAGDVRLVVVDDNRQTLDGIARHLENHGYTVQSFSEPLAALDAMREDPPALLLTDVEMPGMSGLELADEAAGIDPDIRVLVMTGRGDEQVAQAALRADVDDYLTKPVALADLDKSIRKSLALRQQVRYARGVRSWLEEEVRRQTSTIREVSIGAIEALVAALEARSSHFEGHSHKVAECAAAVAMRLDLDEREVEQIRTAALLHDIGMIGVPDSVVEKPGELSAEEYRLVQEHCRTGARILEPLSHLGSVAQFVLEHHERLDGSGYPHRKGAEEISLGGQVVGLAETWTAMSESRSFRPRTSPRDAMRRLQGTAGAWYREDLVKALAAIHVG